MSRVTIIETQRLRMRSWSPDDAPALLGMYSDPAVIEHIPHVRLQDLAGAQAKIREMQALEEKNGCTLWAVERGGELVGVCGFRTPEELGFAFRRDTWGQGFAQEAAEACLRWAESRGVRRFVASTRPGNAGSRRVLDKLGFRPWGQNGEWLVYERLTPPPAL